VTRPTKILRHAWSVFSTQDQPVGGYNSSASSFGGRQDRNTLRLSSERSIISSIYTRIAIDAAAISMKHVRLDEDGRYIEDLDTALNNCLTLEANIDQSGRAFRQDTVMTMLDKGVMAHVPIETTVNPNRSGGYDINSMRVGEITAWYPKHVTVNVYNEEIGARQDITVHKSTVSIVENPLYAVMNSPNSTLQRLMRKLNLLDSIDEQSGSGRLDLIIQLPYVIKSEARKQQAEQRRLDIEAQLKGSQYGIAYTDGTEKITQLNRPAENNLLKQVEYLTEMLYSQLGLTAEVMNGTADEKAMLNYYNRTIEPIVGSITENMKRKFLTKTARTQKQSIEYFTDPFKLVPISEIAEIGDKFTRNEIMTSNEIRGVVGLKPAKDPKADKLVNSNMPEPSAVPPPQSAPPKLEVVSPESGGKAVNH
jgi:hypothetical protein